MRSNFSPAKLQQYVNALTASDETWRREYTPRPFWKCIPAVTNGLGDDDIDFLFAFAAELLTQPNIDSMWKLIDDISLSMAYGLRFDQSKRHIMQRDQPAFRQICKNICSFQHGFRQSD